MAEDKESNTELNERSDAAARALMETLDPYIPALEEKFQALKSQADQFVANFQSMARKIEQQWKVALRPVLEVLSRVDWAALKARLDALPLRSKNAMRLAAERGWFFGWNGSLQDLLELVEAIDGLDACEIDDFLAQYHRENLDAFSAALMSCYPHRAEAIAAAIEAHKLDSRSGYLLAIPVLLAQADGILSEVTDTESALQKAKRGAEQLRAAEWLKKTLANSPDSLDLVDPILTLHANDLFKSASQRRSAGIAAGGVFNALNRHQVIHGEVSDYGTELNSLKAFSFLSFVGLHLPEILNYAADREPAQ